MIPSFHVFGSPCITYFIIVDMKYYAQILSLPHSLTSCGFFPAVMIPSFHPFGSPSVLLVLRLGEFFFFYTGKELRLEKKLN